MVYKRVEMTTSSHRHAERMYPVFDIPLPSPSLKRTQRETNFLSGKNILQNHSVPEDRRQHIAVEDVKKTGRWSWQVLLLFDDEERRSADVKIPRGFVGGWVTWSGHCCSTVDLRVLSTLLLLLRLHGAHVSSNGLTL